MVVAGPVDGVQDCWWSRSSVSMAGALGSGTTESERVSQNQKRRRR